MAWTGLLARRGLRSVAGLRPAPRSSRPAALAARMTISPLRLGNDPIPPNPTQCCTRGIRRDRTPPTPPPTFEPLRRHDPLLSLCANVEYDDTVHCPRQCLVQGNGGGRRGGREGREGGRGNLGKVGGLSLRTLERVRSTGSTVQQWPQFPDNDMGAAVAPGAIRLVQSQEVPVPVSFRAHPLTHTHAHAHARRAR